MMKGYCVAMPYQAIPWRRWVFLSNRIRAFIGIEAIFIGSVSKSRLLDRIIDEVPAFHYEFFHKKPRSWYKIPRKLARDTLNRLINAGHVNCDASGYYLTRLGEEHLMKVLQRCCP